MDVFAYGTLQEPSLLFRLIGRVPVMEGATLPDHVRIRRGLYTTFPHLGENVEGILIRDLTDSEIARLDSYEGCGYGHYERKDVVVRMPDGSALNAQAYLGGPQSRVIYNNWLALQ